jgi:asparagine synthase (glutamine-hydrolysing)
LTHSPAANPTFARAFFAGSDQLETPWFAHLSRMNVTRRAFQFFRRDWRERLLAWDPFQSLTNLLPDDFMRWDPLERDQYVEGQTLMSGYLLSSQGDRMAMAASVETRYPFLDHRVIEFSCALPVRYKLRGLHEKVLLKRSMRNELPATIRERVKQPYRAPDSESFFVDGKPLPYVAEILSESSLDAAGMFEPKAVEKLIRKCGAGKAIGFGDNMAFVSILSTMLLHEQYVRPPGAPVAPA